MNAGAAMRMAHWDRVKADVMSIVMAMLLKNAVAKLQIPFIRPPKI
jgi:hypothetical protein